MLEKDHRKMLPLVRRTRIVPQHHPSTMIVPRWIPQDRPMEWYPPYAMTGHVPPSVSSNQVEIPDREMIDRLRAAGALARHVLELACRQATVGTTTDDIDQLVHETLLQHNAYPSPLNYMGFPKSVCSSINEVICHGIPDQRKLEFGDVVSFDVSCFLNGVHGDNCGTIIVGDIAEDHDPISPDVDSTTNRPDSTTKNWLGIPQRTEFATKQCHEHFVAARKLVQATMECLDAGITTVRNGSCISEIGAACQTVAEQYGFASVSQYRGHGIGENFHIPPYVSHVRNSQKMTLKTDMVFTVEPMICQYSADCFEWESDGWTVATKDGGLSAQFEHMIRVTDDGAEILTIS
jgi:methionyl aminopeptidase